VAHLQKRTGLDQSDLRRAIVHLALGEFAEWEDWVALCVTR
jgi:hypothetical protein